MKIPSGNLLQFATEAMAHLEIVDLPIKTWWFSIVFC